MKIIRQRRPRRFTVIDTELLEDTRLSFRARGLLAYLLSRPDDWTTDHHKLARLGREGEKAIRRALGELETVGYLTRARSRDVSTGRWTTTVEVRDQPVEPQVTTSAVYRHSENRHSVNRHLVVSTDSNHGNLKSGADKDKPNGGTRLPPTGGRQAS